TIFAMSFFLSFCPTPLWGAVVLAVLLPIIRPSVCGLGHGVDPLEPASNPAFPDLDELACPIIYELSRLGITPPRLVPAHQARSRGAPGEDFFPSPVVLLARPSRAPRRPERVHGLRAATCQGRR